VLRINYLGDWGKQFGEIPFRCLRLSGPNPPFPLEGILAVGFERYGSEEELEKDAITHLYDVYVKINKDGAEEVDGKPTDAATSVHDRAREFFVGMENGKFSVTLLPLKLPLILSFIGDEKSLALWRKFRDLSIVKYKETYARLNIYFDVYSGESQVSQASQVKALDTLQALGVVEESQGALIVDLEKYKLGKTVVRKKDGTSVYITRDIGGAVERWDKYQFDKMIYVVANQQDLHLAQVRSFSPPRPRTAADTRCPKRTVLQGP
jgi:arginyl-tRNA synthetase